MVHVLLDGHSPSLDRLLEFEKESIHFLLLLLLLIIVRIVSIVDCGGIGVVIYRITG